MKEEPRLVKTKSKGPETGKSNVSCYKLNTTIEPQFPKGYTVPSPVPGVRSKDGSQPSKRWVERRGFKEHHLVEEMYEMLPAPSRERNYFSRVWGRESYRERIKGEGGGRGTRRGHQRRVS